MLARQTLLGVALAAAIAITLGLAFQSWRSQQRHAQAISGVPRIPDLQRWPADFAREVRAASAAVRSARDPLEPLARLAALYHANAYGAEASQALEALRGLDPREPRWAYRLADLRLRVGDAEAAEPELRRALELAPDYLPAWFRLAELLERRGALDEARDCYARAAAEAPHDERVAYYQIVFEARHGDPREARRRLVELVRAHPELTDLQQQVAELDASEGAPQAAERARGAGAPAPRELSHEDPWIDELNRYGFDVHRLSVLAEEAARERRFETAEQLLLRATRISPGESSAWELLQSVYQQMGRPGDALRTLEAAVAALPDEPKLRARQSELLSSLQQPEQAIALLQTALQRWPDAAPLHAALGVAQGIAGRHEHAARALRDAVRLDPTLVEAQLNLAVSLHALGDGSAARTAVEQSLLMRPDFPEALSLLASVALEAEDLETAEAAVNRLLALRADATARSQFAALQLRKGARAEQSGDRAAARALYRAGLELAPRHAPLLRALERVQTAERADANAPSAAPQPRR
jgi:tetratricopeptide (TPR) repeat protein